MLRLPASVRIHVCLVATDMRRSFDGLCGMVQSVLHESPTNGHLFVFCNRRRDRIKILWWDRDGFAIFYKRLEEGTFRLPTCGVDESSTARSDSASSSPMRLEIDQRAFAMLLEGIDFTQVRKRRRFSRDLASISA